MESAPSGNGDFRDLQTEEKSPQAAADAPEESPTGAVIHDGIPCLQASRQVHGPVPLAAR